MALKGGNLERPALLFLTCLSPREGRAWRDRRLSAAHSRSVVSTCSRLRLGPHGRAPSQALVRRRCRSPCDERCRSHAASPFEVCSVYVSLWQLAWRKVGGLPATAGLHWLDRWPWRHRHQGGEGGSIRQGGGAARFRRPGLDAGIRRPEGQPKLARIHVASPRASALRGPRRACPVDRGHLGLGLVRNGLGP